MRWFVEVRPGTQGRAAEQWVVEAGHWQPALLAARELRGEPTTLHGFAIELLDDGWRAVDPATFTRYLVREAPADTPLTAASDLPIPATAVASVPPAVTPPAAAPQAPDGAAFDLVRQAPPPVQAPTRELLSSRAEEQSDTSRIAYRESAWLVPSGTSPDTAVEALLSVFEEVRASLASAPKGKLVSIAIFDHRFENKPLRPPLASLTWKDWRSDQPQIRRLGEPASIPPASASSSPYSVGPVPKAAWAASTAPEPAPAIHPPPPPVASARPAVAPTPPVIADAQASVPSVPVSRPSVPVVRLTGDDLIADLFQAMHDLHFAADSVVAAEFVLNLALEKMPSRVAMIHFFDIDARQFVVARAKGRGADKLFGMHTPERDPLIAEAMARARPIIVQGAPDEQRLRAERFTRLGYECRSVISGPVEQSGRFLGVIELCNPRDGGLYGECDEHALAYMCEQFAGYLVQRGIILDPERFRSR